MSEISITRFQPAVVARDKVNSVQAVENEVGAEHADQPPGKQESGGQGGGSDRNQSEAAASKPEPGPEKSADDDDTDSDAILEQAVTKLNRYVQNVKRDLIFDIDPLSQEPSVTVVDRESRQVLRHFDSKEALELAKQIDSEQPLSLFKAEV